jgi:ankyrin repeat protein
MTMVDTVDGSGQTALHQAARAGDKQRVEQLLEAGADLEVRTLERGQTPLHLAAAAGHADLVPLLITPTTLDAQDHNNQTALQLAVRARQLEAVRQLAAAGASVAASSFTSSALGQALNSLWHRRCDAELPALLLKAALADPRAAGLLKEAVGRRTLNTGSTLLHLAAERDCSELVPLLVQAGADRDAVNDAGGTPLWVATVGSHAQLVPQLATRSNINKPAVWPVGSPLYIAAGKGNAQLVETLLAAGATADTQEDPMPEHLPSSALAAAAVRGHAAVMALLLTALAKECRQQQQQQQQQRGQDALAALVAAAVAPLTHSRLDLTIRMLEVVLDVLGPEVAGQVCLQVQEQVQKETGVSAVWQVTQMVQALLLGWMEVVKRLHAARQPLVARLQHLVPGVGAAGQQQQQQVWTPQQLAAVPQLCFQDLQGAVNRLAAEAILAAAAGHQHKALSLLREYAGLCLQGNCASPDMSRCPCPYHVNVSDALHSAFQHVARSSVGTAVVAEPASHNTSVQNVLTGPPGVYTTFLGAWVEARRQLQQLPREVVTTVVAAVKAAREQEQQQEDEQDHQHQQQQGDGSQQGPGAGQVPQEEDHLSSQLPGLLL